MPRPKAQPGQTYGKRKEQVESQQAIPIPKRPPGGAGGFGRPTESLMMPTAPTDGRELEYSKSLVEFLPMLEVRAAEPDASGTFRLFVRKVRQMAALASPPNQAA